MAKVLRVETTPNPCARKWVLSERVWEGSKSYLSAGDAEGDGLASALMGIGGVRCVLMCGDWVTVNVESAGKWRSVKRGVEEVLGAWLADGDAGGRAG